MKFIHAKHAVLNPSLYVVTILMKCRTARCACVGALSTQTASDMPLDGHEHELDSSFTIMSRPVIAAVSLGCRRKDSVRFCTGAYGRLL